MAEVGATMGATQGANVGAIMGAVEGGMSAVGGKVGTTIGTVEGGEHHSVGASESITPAAGGMVDTTTIGKIERDPIR
jgi:hypothetical protein